MLRKVLRIALGLTALMLALGIMRIAQYDEPVELVPNVPAYYISKGTDPNSVVIYRYQLSLSGLAALRAHQPLKREDVLPLEIYTQGQDGSLNEVPPSDPRHSKLLKRFLSEITKSDSASDPSANFRVL